MLKLFLSPKLSDEGMEVKSLFQGMIILCLIRHYKLGPLRSRPSRTVLGPGPCSAPGELEKDPDAIAGPSRQRRDRPGQGPGPLPVAAWLSRWLRRANGTDQPES